MSATAGERPLVEVRSLVMDFQVAANDWRASRRRLRAVDGVTFDVPRRETLALVGESGCGKSTVGRALVRLYAPTAGSIAFDGVDLGGLSGQALRRWRRRAQMIFQDPYASLNPRMKVEQLIEEPLRAHGFGDRRERRARVRETLELVGLAPSHASRFPNAFSGGQRQRISIARALAARPELVVADEPLSALDVSVQAQIVNLFQDLRAELGLTLLFISHDLAVVQRMASSVAVMYLGQIVELGPRERVFAAPLHPYTQSLLSAAPVPDPLVERRRERIVLRGDVPSPVEPPGGCRFHTRCPHAMAVCRTVEPRVARVDGRDVACHLVTPPAA